MIRTALKANEKKNIHLSWKSWAGIFRDLLLEILSEGGGCGVERVVDSINDVRGANRAAVEATTVKTLHSFLATGKRIELDVDVAIRVGVNSDVDNLAVLLVALGLHLDLQLFSPVGAKLLQLPGRKLACFQDEQNKTTYWSASKAFWILIHLDGAG